LPKTKYFLELGNGCWPTLLLQLQLSLNINLISKRSIFFENYTTRIWTNIQFEKYWVTTALPAMGVRGGGQGGSFEHPCPGNAFQKKYFYTKAQLKLEIF
jgi:hypothetical protein